MRAFRTRTYEVSACNIFFGLKKSTSNLYCSKLGKVFIFWITSKNVKFGQLERNAWSRTTDIDFGVFMKKKKATADLGDAHKAQYTCKILWRSKNSNFSENSAASETFLMESCLVSWKNLCFLGQFLPWPFFGCVHKYLFFILFKYTVKNG